jgi:hypothetical protein
MKLALHESPHGLKSESPLAAPMPPVLTVPFGKQVSEVDK